MGRKEGKGEGERGRKRSGREGAEADSTFYSKPGLLWGGA